jgi:hypothetical protein
VTSIIYCDVTELNATKFRRILGIFTRPHNFQPTQYAGKGKQI